MAFFRGAYIGGYLLLSTSESKRCRCVIYTYLGILVFFVPVEWGGKVMGYIHVTTKRKKEI